MRVTSVEARVIEAGFQSQALQQIRIASPLSPWPEFAERRASWMWPPEKVAVLIGSSEGPTGISVTSGGAIVAAIVNDHLSRFVLGRNSPNIEETWEMMYRSLLPFDRSGFAMMAIAGIDIALWDLEAKARGQPLVDLLGDPTVEALEAYVTTTRPERFAGAGYLGLKAAMPYGPEAGREGLERNLALLHRYREAAGPDGHVMLDAFMSWDADYTLSFAERAGDLELTWFEDPLPPTDLVGLTRVRERSAGQVKLALGNFCFQRWDCLELLDRQLVSYLQPDVAWAGGITECRRIADLARQREVPVVLHNTAEQPWAISLSATMRPTPWVEVVDRGEMSSLSEVLLNMPTVENGKVLIDRSAAGNALGHLRGNKVAV